ncbi:pyrimidine reductase [Rathayibacter sp. AY2B7]|nr:pyrimidine reductase [Rathayibacter sp. AY2B7]
MLADHSEDRAVDAVGERLAGAVGAGAGAGDARDHVQAHAHRLVGAASVRAEGYRVPRRVPLAVVSATGDLAGHRLELQEGSRVLLLVPESRGAVEGLPAGVEVVPVPSSSERIGVDELLEALAGLGLHRVVCEGGASLSGQFLASGRVDELCLTTSPRVVLPGLPVATGTAVVDDAYSLTLLAADDSGAVYARWSRTR